LDSLLDRAKVAEVVGLTDPTSKYSFERFCETARALAVASTGRALFSGKEEEDQTVAEAAVNIASFLATCAWESGGNLRWTSCDENNYRGWATASCTQREDGFRNDELTRDENDVEDACTVDMAMTIEATTQAAWALGPMKCEPDTPRAGCCWWGRGAIQTTGPYNYKKMQEALVSLSGDDTFGTLANDVNFCTNPGAVCEEPGLNWFGAIEFWTRVVQVDSSYKSSLCEFVDNSFDASTSMVDGKSFIDGTGGLVHNQDWTTIRDNGVGVSNYFAEVMTALKDAGLQDGVDRACSR